LGAREFGTVLADTGQNEDVHNDEQDLKKWHKIFGNIF
jgi:hypothetical protein